MELQHDYNYNDPLELRELFKVTQTDGTSQEYSGLTTICWEDIRFIDQYFYPDNWKDYPGEKFYLMLTNYPTPKLILGSYENITRYWKQMRNEYPIFVGKSNEED